MKDFNVEDLSDEELMELLNIFEGMKDSLDEEVNNDD